MDISSGFAIMTRMCATKEQMLPHKQGSLTEPLLTISGLCFSYPDRPDVLHDISIEVMSGERVGLVGPNGSGKTTLFLVICGVLKPSAGEVVVTGNSVVNGEFRPEIGMVFQNPDDQLFCPSVWDDVAFGPRNMGLAKDEVKERVTEALSIVGVQELADGRPIISQGERSAWSRLPVCWRCIHH